MKEKGEIERVKQNWLNKKQNRLRKSETESVK